MEDDVLRANKYLGFVFLTAALAVPAVTTAAAAQERSGEGEHTRYYDRNHRDYHEWNDREDRSFRVYLGERHREYHEFRLESPRRQRAYWGWRHSHPDRD